MFLIPSDEEHDLRAQADELPGAHAPLRQPAAQLPRPAAALRRVRRRCTATSSRARCTGSCASATSRRTTPTSSARPSRSRTRSSAASTTPATSTTSSGWRRASSSRRGPDNKLGTDEEWDFTEGALRAALERRGIDYFVNEGEGAFYGPKIDLHMTDVLGPLVADGDDPARRADAAALRPHLHGRRQPRAHAVRRPPRAARLARALHRHPHRALRRRVPVLARARPGAGPPGRARSTAPPQPRSPRRCATPASGSTSTTATRRSASGSATPSSRRSRRRSSTATASRRTRSPSATAAAGSTDEDRLVEDFVRGACYAVSPDPQAGSGPVPHLREPTRPAGVQPSRSIRGHGAAACSGFCRSMRRNNELGEQPLRPRAQLRSRRGRHRSIRRTGSTTRSARRRCG